MSKMFVHYSGNKAAFAAATNTEGKLFSEIYKNHIVFIKGEAGECIYTHGAYYGDVKAAIAALENRMSTAEGKIQANDDAIKALKYFSKIKVGDKVATAANKEGTITFSAIDPQEVAIDVDAYGISFGLSETFKKKVDNAADQAAAAAVKSVVDDSIQALESADTNLGNRITALETAVGSGEEDSSLAARMSAAEGDIDALEGLMSGNAEGSVNARIEAAKGYANNLNSAMNTRMESAEGSIATLTGSGEGSVAKALVDAKAYTDAEIAEVNNTASALANRVKANEDAIVVIKGEGEGSIKKAAADAVTKVVAGADADFDTLKEVADWIASDTVGAAAMQTTIARLDGADTVEGSVKKQVKDAVAAEAEIARAAEKVNADAIDAAESRLDTIEADYLKAADKTELSDKITALETEHANDEKVIAEALTNLDTRLENVISDYASADEATLNSAKAYTDEAVAGLDVTDTAVENQFVTAVSEANGKISVSRSAINASQIGITNTENDAFAATTQNVQDALTELASFWAWEEL